MENRKPGSYSRTVLETTTSILVVDDSELIRTRLVSLLEESALNVSILQAPDSSTAYHLFDNNNPGVVILDIHLPGDSGMKVLDYIRKRDKSTTIIMITSYSTEQYSKRCMSLGADAFIEKNDDMEKVVALCRRALDKLSTG